MSSEANISHLKDHGYVVIENSLSKRDVDEWRRKLISYLLEHGRKIDGGYLQPDLFSYVPEIAGLVSAIDLNSIFGCDKEVIVLRHADAHMNKGTGWHKDRPERKYFEESCDYNLYKIGIYLQDHTSAPHKDGALHLVPGSHKISDLKMKANKVAINPSPGDILIFDLRITHKGKDFPVWQKVMKKLLSGDVLSDFRKKRLRDDKVAVFFTVAVIQKGVPKCEQLRWLDEHMEEVLVRQKAQNNSESIALEVMQDNISVIKASGLEFDER